MIYITLVFNKKKVCDLLTTITVPRRERYVSKPAPAQKGEVNLTRDLLRVNLSHRPEVAG